MKKLRMLFLLGGTLLLGVAPLAAQNSVVVLGGGPQPSNTTGCSSLPNCILASFDGSSNSHNGDITAPITANFYYAGGAQTPVTPSAAAGAICLAPIRIFAGLFAAGGANFPAGRGPRKPLPSVPPHLERGP